MSALSFDESERAAQDIELAITRYQQEAGDDIALAFIGELEAAYRLIKDHPEIGSPRYAHAMNIPGLRHRKLRRYPWLVFYIVKANALEIIRVLDAHRDIPAMLQPGDD